MVIEISDTLANEWLIPALKEMQEIYADEDRYDWFDADDIARDVAEFIHEKIMEQGEQA